MDIRPSVKAFIESPKKILIHGEWVHAQSGKTFDVENPADGRIIASCAYGEKADVDMAVESARQAFDKGPWTKKISASDRAKILWKIADLIDKNGTELAQLETLDNGKPFNVALGADIPLAAEIFRYMSGWATKIKGNTFPISVPYTPETKYLSYTLREPIGVVGQIIPWNFPLLMAAWKLAPALAAGCVSILKPAEQTSLSALRLGELMLEAGLPGGVVNIVTGFGDAGAAISSHHKVDKVAFTGSTEVGKLILQAASGNLKKVSLELGGKSPNIIFKDANIKAAINGAASGIFFNHGQCCCAGSRVFVEEDIFDEVVEGVTRIADKIVLGDGMREKTQMGPLVSREQFDRVCGLVKDAKDRHTSIPTQDYLRDKGNGYFVRPTIIARPDRGLKAYQEEIFGPVVCILPFKNQDEMIEEANNSIYGLAAGIWTENITKAHQVSSQIKAGTTWINCYNIFDAGLPFGGYKQSGIGREMGEEVLSHYTETKSVCLPIS